MTKTAKIIATLLKHFFSFTLGFFIACWLAYNVIYGGLVQSQLDNSLITLHYINTDKMIERKEALIKVQIPIEVCNAHRLQTSLLSVSNPLLESLVNRAKKVLAIEANKLDEYCKGRTIETVTLSDGTIVPKQG
ncbi:hypothetical protein [Thalassotalea ganghwensis]